MAEDYGQHRHLVINPESGTHSEIYSQYDLGLDIDQSFDSNAEGVHPGSVPTPNIAVNHRYATIEDLVAIFAWDYLYNNEISSIDSSGNIVKVLNDDGSYTLDPSVKDYCPTRKEIEEGLEVLVNGYRIAFDGQNIPKLKVNNDYLYSPYSEDEETGIIPFYDENMPVLLCDVSLDNPTNLAQKGMTVTINKSIYNFTNYGETGYFDNNIVVNTTSWSAKDGSTQLEGISYTESEGYEYEITPDGAGNFCIQTSDLLVYKNVKNDFLFDMTWEVYKKLLGDTIKLPEYFKVKFMIYYQGILLSNNVIGENSITQQISDTATETIDHLSFVVYFDQIYADNEIGTNIIRYPNKTHYYCEETAEIPVIKSNGNTITQLWPNTIAIKEGDSGWNTPTNYTITAYMTSPYPPVLEDGDSGVAFDRNTNVFHPDSDGETKPDLYPPTSPNFITGITVIQESYELAADNPINWPASLYFPNNNPPNQFQKSNIIYMYINIDYYQPKSMIVNITPRFIFPNNIGNIYKVYGSADFNNLAEQAIWDTVILENANSTYLTQTREFTTDATITLQFQLVEIEGAITISDNLLTNTINKTSYNLQVFKFTISSSFTQYGISKISNIEYSDGSPVSNSYFSAEDSGQYVIILLKDDSYFSRDYNKTLTATITLDSGETKSITRDFNTIPNKIFRFLQNNSDEYTLNTTIPNNVIPVQYYDENDYIEQTLSISNIFDLSEGLTVISVTTPTSSYTDPWIIKFDDLPSYGLYDFKVKNNDNTKTLYGHIDYQQNLTKYTYTFDIQSNKVNTSGYDYLVILFGNSTTSSDKLLNTTYTPQAKGSGILIVPYSNFTITGSNEYRAKALNQQMKDILQNGMAVYNISGPIMTSSTEAYPIIYRWYRNDTLTNGAGVWKQALQSDGSTPATVVYAPQNKRFFIQVDKD